jgi:hypothetical protein
LRLILLERITPSPADLLSDADVASYRQRLAEQQAAGVPEQQEAR